MQVAVYARHSSDKQEHSTRDQIARCQKWCEQKGYVVVDVFCDEEISGSHITTRPGLRRLIESSLLGDFTRVVTEDLSRISRDQEDIASFFKKMTFLDIKIETITEGVINELHIGLKGTMNALYLKDLADKTHRGMIAAVLNGSIPGGRAYGYDVVHEVDSKGEPIRGRRKINEEEAKIIRQIFDMYANGMTLARICDSLNRQTVPSPTGSKWHSSVLVGTSIRNTGILRQTLYNGVVTFNKMEYRKHPETGKRLSIVRPKSEWIRVPAPELSIIPKKLWDRVQVQVEKRSSMAETRRQRTLLMTTEEKKTRHNKQAKQSRARQLRPRIYKLRLVSNKLFCVYHRGKIASSSHPGIYSCHERTCVNRNFKRPLLIRLTQASMASLTLSDLEAYIQSNKDQIAAIRRDDIMRLQEELDTKRTKIANIMTAFEQNAPGREARRHLDKKENECRHILYKIGICNEKIAELGGDYTSEQLESIHNKYMATVQAHINDPENEALNETLYSLIVKIWVTAERDNERKKYTPRIKKIDFDIKQLLKTFSEHAEGGSHMAAAC